MSVSGSTSSTVLITNFNNETVIINGSEGTGLAIIYIQNKSNIIINGLILQNNYQQDAEGIL